MIRSYVHAEGEPDFDDICRIVGAIVAEYDIEHVYLFGSRERGDNRPDSDFCVVTPDDYGLFGVGGFFADLRDTLGVEIDVVCEESIGTISASGSSGIESFSMRRDVGILRGIAKSFPLVGVTLPDTRTCHGVLSCNCRQCYGL